MLVAGIVTAMRTQTSRRGKMAIVTLDDGAGSAEIVVFNETFDAARALLREDQLVIVEARSCSAAARTARRRVCAWSPKPSTISPRSASATRRALRLACNGGADAARLAELIAPFRNGTLPDRRRIPQPWRRRRARAARRVERQPRRSAARPAARVARAGERAGGVLIGPLMSRADRALAARRAVATPRFPAAVERAGHLRGRLAHHAHGAADRGDPRRRRRRLSTLAC